MTIHHIVAGREQRHDWKPWPTTASASIQYTSRWLLCRAEDLLQCLPLLPVSHAADC